MGEKVQPQTLVADLVSPAGEKGLLSASLPKTFGADGVILAETTLEGAAREKHGAAAPGAADAGLFPEVQGRAGGFQGAARPAEARLPGSTVCAAAAGAEGTGDRRRCGNVLRHIVQLL